MATQTMTKKNLSSLNENNKNSFKGMDKAKSYDKSIEGVCNHITEFWSHGYDAAFQALNITYTNDKGEIVEAQRMKYLRPYIMRLVKDFVGLDPRMLTIVTKNDGTQENVLCTWGAKSLENLDVEPTIDAKGKKTYPNIMTTDAKGKDVVVKVDAPRPVKGWTPELLHTFLIQNLNLLAGAVEPYTEEKFHTEYDVDSTNHAIATVSKKPACPLSKKTTEAPAA